MMFATFESEDEVLKCECAFAEFLCATVSNGVSGGSYF